MTTASHIAFIDMVGQKEVGLYNPSQFWHDQTTFQDAIKTHSYTFVTKQKPKGKIFFYSDCAYFEAQSIELLFQTLQSLRTELTTKGCFFKGGVCPGTLKALTIENQIEAIKKDGAQDKHEEQMLEQENFLHGTQFGSSDIVNAFMLQAEIKGIGTNIEKSFASNLPKDTKDKFITPSYYIAADKRFTAKPYYDLKATAFDTDINILNVIFKRYEISNSKDKKLGSYYQSLIATYINSTEFNKIEQTEPTYLKKKYPLIYLVLFLDVIHPVLYEKAYCIEFLLLAILNKIYTEKERDDKISEELKQLILKHDKMISKYITRTYDIPEAVFKRKHIGRFIESYHFYKASKLKSKAVIKLSPNDSGKP